MKIYPSLISSDLLNIWQTLQSLDSHCDGYHLDVMDDHFVPNLTWGPAFINDIRKATSLPIQVHLMVKKPEAWLDRLSLKTCDTFLFHYESYNDTNKCQSLIKKIKDKKWKTGITINPSTSIESIESILGNVDTVLVMSVNPGFSGQSFIPSVLEKIPLLVSLRKKRCLSYSICMDGGINENNIKQLADLGVDEVGIASALFAKPDPITALINLYKAAN